MAKILLADDSTHAQRMGAKILTAEGHEVITVSNGQAAVNSLEKGAPDLVVADIFMPGRNGYELCHFIKTDDRLKTIPVLLVIGAMEPYDPEEGKKAGADGLVTKPLESSNLLETVKELLAASARFAPARPKQIREKLRTKQEAQPGPILQTPAEPAPQEWEEQPIEELISTTTTALSERLIIPKEMSQQPVGMLADLLDNTAERRSGNEAAVSASFRMPPASASPAVTGEPIQEIIPEAFLPPEGLERSGSAAEQPLAPQMNAEAAIWVAESAPVTAEEEKLFAHAAADWGDLTKLVEQNAVAPASSMPTDVPPDLQLDVVPSDLPITSEVKLESFDSLSALVAAPPVSPPPPLPSESPAPVEEPAHTAQVEPSPAAEAAQPPVDPAWTALEVTELVRRSIDQMLPQIVDQIVDRVMQSLKT